ncbi:unnamed protein product, partial [marine sediment metagenome]
DRENNAHLKVGKPQMRKITGKNGVDESIT